MGPGALCEVEYAHRVCCCVTYHKGSFTCTQLIHKLTQFLRTDRSVHTCCILEKYIKCEHRRRARTTVLSSKRPRSRTYCLFQGRSFLHLPLAIFASFKVSCFLSWIALNLLLCRHLASLLFLNHTLSFTMSSQLFFLVSSLSVRYSILTLSPARCYRHRRCRFVQAR